MSTSQNLYVKIANSEENTRRIAYVEQAFGNAGLPLTQPLRVLIGEGMLTKICRKKSKQRQFFLFNDILVYGNIVISKKKFNNQHIIELEDVKVEEVEDSGGLKHGFVIRSPKKSFTVYTTTSDEKTQWMAHIKKCAAECAEKRGSGQRKTSDTSPLWIPDANAPRCMHCQKSEFNILNRRHHCRRCGIVVCSSCSNRRWLLPLQSSKPLRVCLTCYNKLSSSAAETTPQLRMAPVRFQSETPAVTLADRNDISVPLAMGDSNIGRETSIVGYDIPVAVVDQADQDTSSEDSDSDREVSVLYSEPNADPNEDGFNPVN